MCLCLLPQRSACITGTSPGSSSERSVRPHGGDTSHPSWGHPQPAIPWAMCHRGAKSSQAWPRPIKLSFCPVDSWEIINDYRLNPLSYRVVCYAAFLWQQRIDMGGGGGMESRNGGWDEPSVSGTEEHAPSWKVGGIQGCMKLCVIVSSSKMS